MISWMGESNQKLTRTPQTTSILAIIFLKESTIEHYRCVLICKQRDAQNYNVIEK